MPTASTVAPSTTWCCPGTCWDKVHPSLHAHSCPPCRKPLCGLDAGDCALPPMMGAATLYCFARTDADCTFAPLQRRQVGVLWLCGAYQMTQRLSKAASVPSVTCSLAGSALHHCSASKDDPGTRRRVSAVTGGLQPARQQVCRRSAGLGA